MKKALIVLIAAFLLVSCSKKEVKQVTQESKIAQESFWLAETIKNAYLKNDLTTIERNSTKEGYRELLGVIKSFESADITFTPRWVEIENSTVYLNIAWKGTWVVRGQTTEERGMAVFVLEGRPLKLSQIRRENPFRQPE